MPTNAAACCSTSSFRAGSQLAAPVHQLPMRCAIRLWDTCLAEQASAASRTFFPDVCARFASAASRGRAKIDSCEVDGEVVHGRRVAADVELGSRTNARHAPRSRKKTFRLGNAAERTARARSILARDGITPWEPVKPRPVLHFAADACAMIPPSPSRRHARTTHRRRPRRTASAALMSRTNTVNLDWRWRFTVCRL